MLLDRAQRLHEDRCARRAPPPAAGARRSARSIGCTHARTLASRARSSRMGQDRGAVPEWPRAAQDRTTTRRDRRRCRPQRPDHRRLPGPGRAAVAARRGPRHVGGTAASESFAGATVNICNCDHLTFRTTPVIEELRLAEHGLRYVDVDPPSHLMAWSDGTHWTAHHDLERTSTRSARVLPGEVDGYRGYAKAAMPVVRADPRGRHRTAEPDGIDPPRAAPAPGRRSRRCCAGAGAARPTCCAATSPTTP